jgi:hypothetical protein
MKKLLLLGALLFSLTSTKAQFGPFNDIIIGDVNEPEQMIPVDFDLDGDLDILMRSTYEISWYENSGLGEFYYEVGIDYTGVPTAHIDFDVVDFDSDGDYDIIGSNMGDTPSFFKNNGDGTFEEIYLPELVTLELFEAVDFDDDGDIDIVGVSEETIVWFEADGTGEIIDEHVLETLVFEVMDFIIADTDNDSDLDIIWSTSLDGGKVFFIENSGAEAFEDRVTADSGMMRPSSLSATDVDGDLDLDIVYGSWNDDDGGAIHWNENMGDGTFSGSFLISDGYGGEVFIDAGDIDLDGDADLIMCSSLDNSVAWFENTGLATFESPSIMASFIGYANGIALGDIDDDGDLDGFTHGKLPDDKVGWFENATLNPNHVEGRIFLDANENGVMDDTEVGFPWAIVASDPDGTMSVTNLDGTYVVSFAGLADGDYTIFPAIDYWGITTAYDFYDVEVSDDLTFMDTLDFGLFPDELVDSLGTDITGPYAARCNDTIPMWLTVMNLGTTFPSGIMHLELDDNLDYVSSEVAPDSIVGQNLYWSYEDFYYFEIESFVIQVATPEADDVVISTLTSTIVESDEVLFTAVDELEIVIDCAYDPNDKTADPAGEGPEGNISASTEWIEYTVRFQNTGTSYAEDVIIRDQLDENLIWTSIQPLYASHEMEFEFNPSGDVAFVFNEIFLPDSNENEIESHGFVKYRIKLKPDLAIGTTIENTAEIYFDYNPAVITNTTLNTIAEMGDVSIPLNENITSVAVYPNPASDFAYVYVNMEEQVEYTIHMYSVIGQAVYLQENISVSQTKISTSQLEKGLYILVIESSVDGSQLFNSKLIIE